MLALYFQQFSTRGQNMDLFRLPVELLGKRVDRLDYMLTAIENDKKLSRTNEVDQLQAGVFRFECKSQGCRDSPRNMARIGEAFQIYEIDFPAKLLGGGAANSQCNGRLANAAGTEQCYEPFISKLVATSPTTVSRPIIVSGRTGSLPWCRNLSFLLSVLPARGTTVPTNE